MQRDYYSASTRLRNTFRKQKSGSPSEPSSNFILVLLCPRRGNSSLGNRKSHKWNFMTHFLHHKPISNNDIC